MITVTSPIGGPRNFGFHRPLIDQSIWKAIATVCAALVLVILSIGPMTRALSFPSNAVPATHPSVAAASSSKSIPAGLQGAIHRALGPGPIGLGTAPLVSGIAPSSAGWSALAPHQGLSATIARSGALHVSLGNKGLNGSLMARSLGTGTDATVMPLHVTL
jgi:hypothetical protein